MSTSTPTWDRDEQGLLGHVNYVKKPNGKIDWRKMIEPEYIVPNSKRTSETDISKLEDKDLLILIQGFKEVAQIRGYSELKTDIYPLAPDFIAARTSITWIPNFENKQGTSPIPVTSTGAADAHPGNTSGFGSSFLTTMAENRSVGRAVRSFLNIPVLGQDEIGDSVNPEPAKSDIGEHAFLDSLLKDNNIGWENFKNKMTKLGFETETWNDLQDVPKSRVFEIIEAVKNALAAKAQKKAAKT